MLFPISSSLFFIHEFIKRIKNVTDKDIEQGITKLQKMRGVIEELGEYAAASAVEDGLKNKQINETAKQEAVDLFISSLSLFYAEGGTDKELVEYGNKKLNKWIKNRRNK